MFQSIAAFLLGLSLAGQAGDISTPDRERLVAVIFHSKWCGACKITEPRFASVLEEYANAPLAYVTFDFTYGRHSGLARKAEEEGIAQVYMGMAGTTGFILLIDRETHDVLAHITMHYSEDDIRGALDHALAIIRQREDFNL